MSPKYEPSILVSPPVNTWWKCARLTEGHVQVLPCMHLLYRIVKNLGNLQYTLSAASCFVVMVGSGLSSTTMLVATRVISQLVLRRDWLGQAIGDLTRRTVELRERRLCPCGYLSPLFSGPAEELINWTRWGKPWCLRRNRRSLVRGCETTIRGDIFTVQKIRLVESRGAVCRPHQFLLIKDISQKSKPCITVIG